MSKFKLKSGTEATFCGISDTISFQFEELSIDVDFDRENYEASIMIADGNETELYPETLINSTVTKSSINEDWDVTKKVKNMDGLVNDINECILRVKPGGTKYEAYHGI